jgi:uncharacterized protein VirK/YbjX
MTNSVYDVGNFMDKTYYNYRKGRYHDEVSNWRFSFSNWMNTHYVRHSDTIQDQFNQKDLPKKIYQARPSIILNIDNEHLTFGLMDKVSGTSLIFLSSNRLLQEFFIAKTKKTLSQQVCKRLETME